MKNNITKFQLKITDITEDAITFELATNFDTYGKNIVLKSKQFTDFAIRLAANVHVADNLLNEDDNELLSNLGNLFHLRLNIFDKHGDSIFTKFREQVKNEREKWLEQEKKKV